MKVVDDDDFDVFGDDDAVPSASCFALQINALCFGRRLEFTCWVVGCELRKLIAFTYMNAQMVLTMGQDALLLLLMVSAPVLGAALLVGLLVSLFQAVTQIQEATLAFVPKLVAAIAVFAIAGPWMLTILIEYIRRILEAIPSAVV